MSKLLKSMFIGLTILAAQPVQAHLAAAAVQVMGTVTQVVGVGIAFLGLRAVVKNGLHLYEICNMTPGQYATAKASSNTANATNPLARPLTATFTEYKRNVKIEVARVSGLAAFGAGIYTLGSLAKEKPAEKEVTL